MPTNEPTPEPTDRPTEGSAGEPAAGAAPDPADETGLEFTGEAGRVEGQTYDPSI